MEQISSPEIFSTEVAGGVQFIWAISIGQIMTMCVAALGFLSGVVSLIATVRSHGDGIKNLRRSHDDIKDRLDELAKERHDDTKELRAEMLQFRREMVETEKQNADNLMIVRQVLKHLVEKIQS